jgi:hypothetical protein
MSCLASARRLLFVLLALLAAACSDADTPTPGASGPDLPDDGLPASCNPLRTGGACALPFPSAVFQEEDAATESGMRNALVADVLPRNDDGVVLDPVRLDRIDGFSVSSQLLAYFPERLDPSSLPSRHDPEQSLAASSATVIVDMATGERVVHFSEVDAQVGDTDRQALIVRPLSRLAGGRRYAVAVTRTARTLTGEVPTAPPGFHAALAGRGAGALGAKQAARMPAIVAALEGAGVAESELLLAWDFVTASDASATGWLRSMREQALAQLGEAGLGYTITSVEEDFSEHILRRVRGTFTVPRFLTQTDVAVPEATLTFDEAGAPVQDGTYQAPFTVVLPRAAQAGPVKLLLFGHGFLGSGEDEIGGPEGSYLQTFADSYGYALVATDWSGLSKYEGADAAGSGAATAALADMNAFPWVSDRLHQAIVAAMTLARTARGALAADEALFIDGAQVIDDDRIDYYGISLGGVMGAVLMGYSPDLQRGVLNVGGAGWSLLMQRSTNWALFKIFLDDSYPDKLDQQMVIDVIQAYLDPADGMTTVPLLSTPLPANPAKQILLQMAVADAQVPNLATEAYARSVGLPVLEDAAVKPWGLAVAPAPLESALSVWDTHEPELPPETNTSSIAIDNSAHGKIRALPALMEQVDVFFRTGEVRATCEGLCDPQ